MKTILINPKLQTINYVDYNGDYKQIYKFLECSTYSAIYPFEKSLDALFHDDIGSLGNSNYYFKFTYDDGYQSLIGGNGLIIGCDDKGESKHAETSIDEIKKRVTFIGNQEIVHGQNGITLYPLPTILNDDDLELFTDEEISIMAKDHD